MLKVNGIQVKYGNVTALTDLSIHVNEGEIVTIIGSNGAGKTTTLNTISGLLKPTQGSIEFMGERCDGKPPYEIVSKGLIQVPEGRRLFPNMTVYENIEVGSFRPGKKPGIQLEKIYGMFPKLKERSNQLAGSLSGGEQQMLAIARAITMEPKLLMFDEPTLGLAPLIVKDVFEIIKRIREMGTTILLVEQNARASLEISDRAYVLESGQLLMEGNSKDLLNDDRVRKAYLGM